MGNQFCTSCGHSVEIDAKFCDDCGAVFQNARPPESEALPGTSATGLTSTKTTREAVVKHARFVVSAWVIPFNATLVFGSTLVAVFDFLSPRVALLPIAATVAVVGLIAALALRKFVAPSLPEDSAFKRALAPEMGVHRSPVLIATGLLSALMVSGAAWSSAASSSGGVIASKFDSARNAQMQLGVMQGLQKEQRVQTAVLEDIREGRTANPRRELANQGILWTTTAFNDAVEKSDKPVVSLFLAGGMKWDLNTVKYSQRLESSDIQLLLLAYPKSLEKNNQCLDAIYQITEKEIDQLRKLSNRKAQSVPRLSGLKTRLLKLFCSEPAALAAVVARIKEQEEDYKRWYGEALHKQAVRLGPAPSITRTPEECISELSASNGLRIQNALASYEYSLEATWWKSGRYLPDGRDSYARLMDRAKANSRFFVDSESKIQIADFCASNENNISTLDDYNLQIFKQVYSLLS